MLGHDVRLLLLLLCLCAEGAVLPEGKERGAPTQHWGYVTVRPGAHMFWWLYCTTAAVTSYTERPLVVWLQGGPGMPASGYGNFGEVGPLTAAMEPREYSPVSEMNVLFVDSPVGVGYSYVAADEGRGLAGSGEEVARDLAAFLEEFVGRLRPEFGRVPLYVFGESYGGKMAVELVHLLHVTNRTGNLAGVGLGDAYVSPVDYVQHYAPLALELGLVDKEGFARIDELAKQIQVLIKEKLFEEAADVENRMTDKLVAELCGIDVYNILVKSNTTLLPKFVEQMPLLEELMNNYLKGILDIPEHVTWSFFKNEIHAALQGDLMRSVTNKIETLLNETDFKIIVYNGNLDFIVNTAGTIAWLEKLNWPHRNEWLMESSTPLEINMVYEGYYKRSHNLIFYSILRAGHSVPVDTMSVMKEMLQREILFNYY